MMFEIKDGLMVKINESDKTASITKSPKATGNICVPCFYEKENIKYKIISIEHNAFEKCNIDSLTFPEDSEIEVFGTYCFNQAQIKKLQIPSRVNKIDLCFNDIKELNEIELSPNNDHFILFNNQLLLGKSKKDIDKFDVLHFGMFEVEEAVIPSQVRIIKEYSFYSYYRQKKLKSIKFEENSELKIIEYKAFQYTNIENLLFPASVEEIRGESFESTSNLKSVSFPSNSKLKKIDNSAFLYSSIESISLPASVEYIADYCFLSTPNLCKIEVSAENKFFKMINGDYIVKESQKGSGVFDVIILARRNLESITIPSRIKVINCFAFYQCKQIKSISFEPNSSLELIKKYAFYENSPETIILPPSLKKVNKGSFYGNRNLKYVEFLSKSIKIKNNCFGSGQNISTIIFSNADQIVFDDEAMSGIPDNMKILVRKNAQLSGDGLNSCRSKIYYIEDIEEERLRKEEEERLRKEDFEEKLQSQQKDFEEKLQNQQKDFEEKLQNQQKDFEEKLQNQQKDFENKKKEFDDQMKSMFELIMKQQAAFAKQNEEMAATKNNENEKKKI